MFINNNVIRIKILLKLIELSFILLKNNSYQGLFIIIFYINLQATYSKEENKTNNTNN